MCTSFLKRIYIFIFLQEAMIFKIVTHKFYILRYRCVYNHRVNIIRKIFVNFVTCLLYQ